MTARLKISILLIVIISLVVTLAYLKGNPTHQKATSSTTTSTTTTDAIPTIPQEVSHFQKDVSIFPEFFNTSEINNLLDLAAKAKVQVISTDVNFETIEPQIKAYSWSNLDSFVRLVLAKGFKLKFQLEGFPDWARDPNRSPVSVEPWLVPTSQNELSNWSKFVRAVVSRYKGKIEYYEIWNEPNIESFFQPFPDPAIYSNLLEASYSVIKSVDPNAQVMFAGLSRNDLGYLNTFYQATSQRFGLQAKEDHFFFDILGVHPYCSSRSPEVNDPQYTYNDGFGIMNENFLGLIDLHQVMASFGDGAKHEYISEFGYTTSGYVGFPAISDTLRASYLHEAYDLASSITYVDGLSWYAFEPTPYVADGWSILSSASSGFQPTATYAALVSAP